MIVPSAQSSHVTSSCRELESLKYKCKSAGNNQIKHNNISLDFFRSLRQNSFSSTSDSHCSIAKDDESQILGDNVSENQNPKYEISQIHSKQQQQQPRQELTHEKNTHDSISETQSLLHPTEMDQENTPEEVNGTNNNYNSISYQLNADSRRYAKKNKKYSSGGYDGNSFNMQKEKDSENQDPNNIHSDSLEYEWTDKDSFGFVTSSEMEPSPHQIEIPPCSHFLFHARICALMEKYDLWRADASHSENAPGRSSFGFSSLVGMNQVDSEPLSSNNSKHNRVLSSPNSPSFFLQGLFECTDDLVEEGHFSSIPFGTPYTSSDIGGYGGAAQSYRERNENIQVTIFSSKKNCQFIVCYRGSTSQQKNPFSKQRLATKHDEKKSVKLHPKQPVSIHSAFHKSYYSNDMEEDVFSLLSNLSRSNPFFYVTFTGHSYGGALATIGAVRYAISNPLTAVSCHLFGAPKVGGIAFRHLSNSLPNLKVMRVEHGFDPIVHMPERKPKWMHVGHTIIIDSFSTSYSSNMINPLSPLRERISNKRSPINKSCIPITYSSDRPYISNCEDIGNGSNGRKVSAYRFDQRRRFTSEKQHLFQWNGSKKRKQKDHEISSYVKALEYFCDASSTCKSTQWVTRFVGEEGNGVRSGNGDELRFVV